MKQAALLWLFGVLTFTASFATDPKPRQAHPRQPEAYCRDFPGPKASFAWENDLVAFRAFGPGSRSGPESAGGIECWPKRVSYPVIDHWAAAEKSGKPIVQDRGEGYAFYQVGNSLGCGGTALWVDGRIKPAGPYRTWTIVSPENTKCEFELTYEYPAEAGESPIRETKRISLQLGQRFFRCESTFTQDDQPVPDLPIAIGVTTHDDKATGIISREQRWVACWENIDEEFLGSAAILAPNQPIEAQAIHSPQPDQSHVVLLTRTNAQGKVIYYAGFAWNRACGIGSQKQWEAILDAFSKGLGAP